MSSYQKNNRSLKNFFYYYSFISLLVLLVDRLSKTWMLNTPPLEVNAWLSLEPSLNRGFSWSIFSSENTFTFIGVSLCVLLFFLLFKGYTLYRIHNNFPAWGEALILGGALSNLIDRVVYHGVVDFIVLSCGSLVWPSFNIADAAICLGAFIMLIQTLKEQ